jgi:hypothetical protein
MSVFLVMFVVMLKVMLMMHVVVDTHESLAKLPDLALSDNVGGVRVDDEEDDTRPAGVPDVDSDRDVDGSDGIAVLSVSWTAWIASFVVV